LKIVVDMNLSLGWADFLQQRGFSCQHWSEIGSADADDQTITEHCLVENAVILTADLDFGDLHAQRGTSKPSVIQIRGSDKLPTSLGHSVAKTLSVARLELERGAIVTITSSKVRVSKLPIGNLDDY
jgi:predicted nuclease of predicted toxin-antitoxin system